MKKWYRILLTLALVFSFMSLAACGNGTDEPQNAGGSDASADAGGAGSQEEGTPVPDPAEPTEPGSAPETQTGTSEDAPAVPPETRAETALEEAPKAPAEQPASEPVEKPAPEPAEQPASEPAEKPASEPAEQPAPEPAEPAAGVSLPDVRDKMVSELGISDYTEISAKRLLDLYGIEEGDYKQSASFATASGAFPGEVVVLEAVDADAAQRIASHLQTRLDEVLNQYKTYDAETYALAEACTIDTDGNIVSMILSPERAEMCKILTDSLG